MNIFKKFLFPFSFFLLGIIIIPTFSYAENVINLNATSLLPHAELFITPHSSNFLVDSTFETPIYLDTLGNNINAVSLKISFDPKKLSIVKPSGGKSIFGIWVETPTYDNTLGTASLVGVIPGGITTSSGLIATITFKALASGTTKVNITDYSSANLNDGLGSEIRLTLTGASYTLNPRPPEGVIISSETHPSQDRWYNNNSPILNWDRQNNYGFSIAIDSSPQIVLLNTITTTDSSISYQNLNDGIWYFHVKASKENIWGNTSNFQIKIDTTPPAEFTPKVSTLQDSGNIKKYLVSFFTTDTLSGIDHYEVGVVEEKAKKTTSPVFIQTESPYLVPLDTTNNMRVLIRAFDTAGNLRESYVDLYPNFTMVAMIKRYTIYILSGIIFFLLIELLAHFLFGHHIFSHFRRAYQFFKKMSKRDDLLEKNIESSIPVEEEIATQKPEVLLPSPYKILPPSSFIKEETSIQEPEIPLPPHYEIPSSSSNAIEDNIPFE